MKSEKEIYDKICYNLNSETGFIGELNEDLYFNIKKYNDLLKLIKELNLVNNQYIKKELLLIFFEKITYMYDILRDLYVHPNKMNITKEKYYENILKLKDNILILYEK